VRHRVGKRVQFAERCLEFRSALLELRVEFPDVLGASAFLGDVAVHPNHAPGPASGAQDRLFARLENAHGTVRGPPDPEFALVPSRVHQKILKLCLLARQILGMHPFRPGAVGDPSVRGGGQPVDLEHLLVPHDQPGAHGPFPNPDRGRFCGQPEPLFPERGGGAGGGGAWGKGRSKEAGDPATGFRSAPGPGIQDAARNLDAELGFTGEPGAGSGLEFGPEVRKIFRNHPGLAAGWERGGRLEGGAVFPGPRTASGHGQPGGCGVQLYGS
jgi:hypothetical protein